ncbi:response regulator receiver modulated diguanylate cyclase/phosphodiesterase with PAS/PAC sensor(s) [Catenovulum agarivorans DS-2]|uniref:cyclic-guanylate-specific phosphodiesterase n=1 Tax=Catenovulum agarivorans DS-2 TaxID=1328313 RepID=W7QKY8_9ALTE|nr:EAL domain-containing protein [Catenovulum agarivorans]EWH09607.1 response regulator receiver modulated diguanylate cyclase/phosphodiesterase with PAS/PAC sensor(s) [Catenovulum agarivorans DS-2]
MARILLVEDELIARELIKATLKADSTIDLDTCDTVKKAQALLSNNQYDLVILDISLPDGSGVTILELIRSTESAISLPVVMVSAHRNNRRIVSCLRLGANDYITKPIDVQILLARIQNLLLIKRLDSDRRQANERFSLAAMGANDGLWDWLISSDEAFFSSRWKKMLGYDEQDFPNQFNAFVERIHPNDTFEFNRSLRHHLEGISEHFCQECRIQHADGTYRWMMVRGAAIRHKNGKAYRMAGSMTDFTNRKIIDPIADVLNRSAFIDRMELLLQAVQAQQITNFTVILISLNRYKLIRDSYGHHFCDRLIFEVASTLSAIVPPQESLARVDDEKFALTVQNASSVESCVDIIEQKIIPALKTPLMIEHKEIHLTFSTAIVAQTASYINAADILRDADIALNDAWLLRNQQIAIFQPKLQTSLKDKAQLEEDLHKALESNSFDVFYQAKVDSKGQIVGAEALARWFHPTRGLISPADFIPIAEETGLIIELGKIVLTKVCKQLQLWFEKGIKIPVAVNLSARQLINQNLQDDILNLLHQHRLPNELLELEVTETLLLENLDAALPILNAFHRNGIKVSIDDFGTGYSSLAYLKSLPLNTLKIDKSFIKELPNNENDKAIVEAIAYIAKALGLSTIAEGVETKAQLNFLQSLNVCCFQGFYFYKPLPVEAFEDVMNQQITHEYID